MQFGKRGSWPQHSHEQTQCIDPSWFPTRRACSARALHQDQPFPLLCSSKCCSFSQGQHPACLFTALPVQPLSWHCSFFSMTLILPPNRPSLNHLSCCLPPPCLAYRSHSAKVSGGGTDESTCGLEATPYSQSPLPLGFVDVSP